MQNYNFGVNVGKVKNICSSFVNSKSKEYNITSNQEIFLKSLLDPNKPSQKDIIQFVGCDKAQASRILQELKDKGLVTEKIDPQDNRKKIYEVTAEGKRIHEQIDRQLSHFVDSILFEGFSREQKQQFCTLLDKIINNLNNYNKEEK